MWNSLSSLKKSLISGILSHTYLVATIANSENTNKRRNVLKKILSFVSSQFSVGLHVCHRLFFKASMHEILRLWFLILSIYKQTHS